MAKKFPMVGGPGDGKVVELEFPYRDFRWEEDGKVRTGPSDGECYDIRRVPWPYSDLWFAVHKSLWKADALAVWADSSLKKAYEELLQ